MKVRITFWIMMMAIIAVSGILLWLHYPRTARNQIASLPASLTSSPQKVLPGIAPQTPPVAQSRVISKTTPGTATATSLIIDQQIDYRQREEAVKALKRGELTDADRDTLYGFLREHDAQDDTQMGQVLKNQLLDVLCEMQPPPKELGELLQQIFQDQSQSVVLRDYAVQHLGAFYEQMAASSVDEPTRDQGLKLAQQTLWSASDETDDSIAGTALLAMTHLLQDGFSQFDPSAIGSKALALAGGNGSEMTRITAYQVCATLNVQGALPVVEAGAQNGQSVPLQISAIGALGAIGTAADLPLLQGLLQNNDPRLQLPVQTAIGKIEQRTQARTPVKAVKSG